MKLQLLIFVYDRVDEIYSYKCLYMIGLMKLQLQIFVQDRVDETTATNVCVGYG